MGRREKIESAIQRHGTDTAIRLFKSADLVDEFLAAWAVVDAAREWISAPGGTLKEFDALEQLSDALDAYHGGQDE